MKILEMCEEERPREKLLSKGPSALGNGELLSVILRGGTRGESALDLAQRLLSMADGKLSALANMSSEKMSRLSGIGPCKAAEVAAALELGRRFFLEAPSAVRRPLVTARMVYDLMIPLLKGLDHEECWVVLLNDHNYETGKLKVTSGGSSSTVIDVRQLSRMVLERGASGIFLIHNHPTGNPAPSKADVKQTELLHKALSAVGIALVDHVVVSDGAFFSFAEDRMSIV